jgi:hypothetical protein
MISMTSFAYVAGLLVVAGVYALWRSEDAPAAAWGVTATCGGVAILAAAYARWWGVEDGHTLAVAALVAGFMLRVAMVGSTPGRPRALNAVKGLQPGEVGDVVAVRPSAEEVEYGP